MSLLAQYVNTPKNSLAQLTTADTATNNPTTAPVVVQTAGSNGARIDAIQIQATGTTVVGLVRFFISTDSGTTKRLLAEIPVTAATPSATSAGFNTTLNAQNTSFLQNGLVLEPNAILYATTTVAGNTLNVIPVVAGNF